MTKINMTFSEEELARMAAEFEQKINEEKERLAKLKDIYNQLFGELSLTDKLAKFIESDSWVKRISNYFKANRELMNDLSLIDVTDFGSYMDEFFIKELKDNFTFVDLNFDKLDLSDEDIELWEKSTVFWFTTGLWLVTVEGTDYIVHEMSGQGETLYFIDTLDEVIVNDPNAKAKLSADDLTKFAEQFKEFALKCKN
jgi:hypothetical protein